MIVCALALMLLVACGTQTGTTPTGTPSQPEPPEPSVTPPAEPPSATPPAPSTTETAPATPPAETPPSESTLPPKGGVSPGACLIGAERIQLWCKTAVLPEVLAEENGCQFKVPATGDKPGGAVWVTRVPATLDDYIDAYREIYVGDETMELKPRSTRREKVPFTYFFWFTGENLLTIKAHKSICVSDNLKKIAIEAEEGQGQQQSCSDLNCRSYTFSTCPIGCNKECIPSAVTNTTQSADCEGYGSCRCIGEPRPAAVATDTTEPFCGTSVKDACSSNTDCKVGGCSSQVCGASADTAMTTCEYRDCFKAMDYALTCKCVSSQCQWAK